jgi:hypothetical protein
MNTSSDSAVPHYRIWRQQITASEAQERVVRAGVEFPADEKRKLCSEANVRSTTERTRPSPEPWSVQRAGDHRFLASAPQLATVLVLVIAAIGDHRE